MKISYSNEYLKKHENIIGTPRLDTVIFILQSAFLFYEPLFHHVVGKFVSQH